MATVTYPSLTTRNTQQSSAIRSQGARSQNNQYSTIKTRSQTSSIVEPTNAQNTAIAQTPVRSSSYGSPYSNQSGQPTTPAKYSPIKKESPGAWKHPRAEDIARRQKASSFGAENVSLIMKNIGILFAFELLRWMLPKLVWKLISPVSQFTGRYPVWAFWLAIAYVIFSALKPLWTGPDQLLDIDLNATQRYLLSLDPNATPPVTPTTKYVTPPKYTRSATPLSGTPGSRGSSPSASPLAYKNDLGYRRSSDSFSSSKRISFGSDPRRQSFGLSTAIFGTPSKDGSTPSPMGKGSGIPFSNRWLYHKGTANIRGIDSF